MFDHSVIFTSLAGDALALGPHWIYDGREIARKFPSLREFHDPASPYHPGKRAGDFTHYGDQTMVLLESVSACGGFDAEDFKERWIQFWENPDTTSYRDGATKGTLENWKVGVEAASNSNDIAGAARMAPLFAAVGDVVVAAREQAALTHGDPAVGEAAEFFAKVTLEAKTGMPIAESLRAVAESHAWRALDREWFDASVESAESQRPDVLALKMLGLTCHTPDAFRAVCHLLLRDTGDTLTVLSANASAGGDSAARGMLLGMVLGASPHAAPLPAGLVASMRQAPRLSELLKPFTSKQP